MATLDNGYKMEQVCKKYKIPWTNLRGQYNGKTNSRKFDPKLVFAMIEEDKIIKYKENGDMRLFSKYYLAKIKSYQINPN